MDNHFELTDIEFEQKFAGCQIDPALFSHEAHLRLAWIHISRFGIDSAIENICKQLKMFVTFLGASDKYNETVTVAAVKAVYHFKLKSSTENFRDFIAENPRLKTHFKELLAQHYMTDIFTSEEAKEKFLEAELLAFD